MWATVTTQKHVGPSVRLRTDVYPSTTMGVEATGTNIQPGRNVNTLVLVLSVSILVLLKTKQLLSRFSNMLS